MPVQDLGSLSHLPDWRLPHWPRISEHLATDEQTHPDTLVVRSFLSGAFPSTEAMEIQAGLIFLGLPGALSNEERLRRERP